jgi:hypothetical protein
MVHMVHLVQMADGPSWERVNDHSIRKSLEGLDSQESVNDRSCRMTQFSSGQVIWNLLFLLPNEFC